MCSGNEVLSCVCVHLTSVSVGIKWFQATCVFVLLGVFRNEATRPT